MNNNNNCSPFIILTTQRSRSTYFYCILKQNITGSLSTFGELGQDKRIWDHYKEGYTIKYSNLNVPILSNYDENKIFSKMKNNDFVKVMYNHINIDSLLNKNIKIIHLIRDAGEVALSQLKAQKTGIYHITDNKKKDYYEKNYVGKIEMDEKTLKQKKENILFEQNKHKDFLEQNNLDYITIDSNNIDWNLIETFLDVKIYDKNSHLIPLSD